MELSKQTQTIIALISGVMLGALLVFLFMQNYYESKISQAAAPTTETRQVADEQPAPDPAATQTPAATTETAEDKPVESATEPQATPPATPAPEVAAESQTPEPAQPETSAAAEPAQAVTVAATDAAAYAYTARPGDAYSILTRKAVQTYGLKNKVTLSPAQIIAAETFLSEQAGSPELNEGQQVTIAIDSVKSAVDSAQKLSAGELALWDVYVQDVDFNTNANG